ncbi:hypothetical protein GN956_G8624 [Arapaima gigas]
MPEERRTYFFSYCLSSWLALLSLLFIVMGQTEASLCSHEITRVVNGYLTAVREMKNLESKLYTPDVNSYEQTCPNSILTCFAEESKVMLYELENELASHKSDLYEDLPRRLATFITKKDEEHCKQCEYYKEASVEEFLDTLHKVLQVMNSRC